jgi:hypothetical protein
VDDIAPPAGIAPFVGTLCHLRGDEPVIRDIQPGAIGNPCLFPLGKGVMHFAAGPR